MLAQVMVGKTKVFTFTMSCTLQSDMLLVDAAGLLLRVTRPSVLCPRPSLPKTLISPYGSHQNIDEIIVTKIDRVRTASPLP
jgi:hypothetical protein